MVASPSQATLTIDLAHVFLRLTGHWTLQPYDFLPDRSGSISGVALWDGVKLRFSIPLLDAGSGLKSFDAPGFPAITMVASNIDVDFRDSLVNALAGALQSFLASPVVGKVGEASRVAVAAVLVTIPPFGL